MLALGLLVQAGTAWGQSYPIQSSWDRSKPAPSTYQPVGKVVTPYSAVQPTVPAQAVPPPPQVVQQTAAQKTDKGGGTPGMPYNRTGLEALEFRNLREVPGIEILTRIESQAALEERMKQEALKGGERIVFPEETPLTKEQFKDRDWPKLAKLVEPNFVMHGRLLFEQQNFERGLWNLGILTPVASAGKFYWDVATLPYNLGTRPFQQYDTSAGKCLPGDPTPLYLYPVELSLSGFVAEAAVITGGFFIFP